MTDRKAIALDYLRREAAANKTAKGADHSALMLSVALLHGVSVSDVRAAVLDETVKDAN